VIIPACGRQVWKRKIYLISAVICAIMIKINEIFYSIQGESSYIGLPCVFIRVVGCNLRCAYCDTSYSYNKGKDYEIDELLSTIKVYKCRLIEITGGEPLLQKEVFLLVDKLVDKKCKVLIETNGTVDLKKLNNQAIVIMDIKCPSSGEEDKILWRNIYQLKPKDEIKFVISDRKDYVWAKNVIYKFKLTDRKVLFAPTFRLMDLDKLANWILEDSLSVRLQPQLHKLIGLK